MDVCSSFLRPAYFIQLGIHRRLCTEETQALHGLGEELT
jgi:hypothetical protein